MRSSKALGVTNAAKVAASKSLDNFRIVKNVAGTGFAEFRATVHAWLSRGGGIYDEIDILLLSHALEKGMGVPAVRIGYGQQKAAKGSVGNVGVDSL